MIVKSGRLYLWYNDISTKELIIKVGSGSGSSEYLEIDQTDLAVVNTGATVKVTTEAKYNLWYENQVTNADVWTDTIADITSHIFNDERKIIIYVMIKAEAAFELGEMGLFVMQSSEAFNDWVGETIPTSLPPSPVEGDMYFTIVDNSLHTYTDDWVGETIPTSLPPSYVEGDMYFDTVDNSLHTYTNNDWVRSIPSFTKPVTPDVGDTWFDTTDYTFYTYTADVWVDSTPSFTKPVTPDVGDTWFDTTDYTLYTFTADVNHDYPEVMISRNLMTKQFISTTETKIIKYTINI